MRGIFSKNAAAELVKKYFLRRGEKRAAKPFEKVLLANGTENAAHPLY